MCFNRRALKLLTVSAVMVCASEATAQRSVPGVEVRFGNWQFVPTFYNGAVETIVALRTDGAVGENITTMWFTKETGGQWATWAFQEQNQAKTIGCIKAILLLPDDSDEVWRVAPAAVDPVDYPRAEITRGVFANDPFAEAVSSSTNPEVILDFLVSAGWQAARSDIFVGFCPVQDWLDAISLGAEAEMATPFAGATAMHARLGPICQGGGGGGGGGGAPPTCTRSEVIGAPGPVTCQQSSNWWHTGTVMQPITGAGCCPSNSYEATFTQRQQRTVTVTCADCSVVNFLQLRINHCTSTIGAVDTANCIAVGIPCPPVPAGYTPPANPPGGGGVGSTCVAVVLTCSGWDDWGPPCCEHICP